eukprot:3256564-Amphidinium_carterae.1
MSAGRLDSKALHGTHSRGMQAGTGPGSGPSPSQNFGATELARTKDSMDEHSPVAKPMGSTWRPRSHDCDGTL